MTWNFSLHIGWCSAIRLSRLQTKMKRVHRWKLAYIMKNWIKITYHNNYKTKLNFTFQEIRIILILAEWQQKIMVLVRLEFSKYGWITLNLKKTCYEIVETIVIKGEEPGLPAKKLTKKNKYQNNNKMIHYCNSEMPTSFRCSFS